MAQGLQLLAETREISREKETCKGTSSSEGTEPLPATVGRAGATGSHTVLTPYGHRGMYIAPPGTHPPDSSLQRCQVTSTASLQSHTHSPVAPIQAHIRAGGSQGSHPPALTEEEFQSQPLLSKERLESCLECSEPSLLTTAFL